MPWNAVSSLINGTNQFGLGIANTIVGYNMNKENQDMQLKINRENAQLARELNEKNRQYELEDQAYLAGREDSAIQRKAADLAAAGINPLMAAGGAGGGTASGLPSARNTSNMIAGVAPQSTNPIDTESFSKASEAITNGFLEARKKVAEIKNIEKGTEGKDLENIGKEIENRYKEEQIRLDLEKTTKGNALTKQQTENLIQTHMVNASQEQRNKAMFEIDKAGKELDNELKKLDKEIAELEKQGITEENAREAEKFEIMKEERWLFYLDSITSSLSKITEMGNKVKNLFNRGQRRGRNP
jgi:uncharacterized protein YeaC (DUF1315 family)